MSRKLILLFRSKTDDSSSTDDLYEKSLQHHGYHVKTISPIQFRFINHEKLVNHFKDKHYQRLIFTSKRAVEAFQRVKNDIENHWKIIYVEGKATGAFVRDVFGSSVDVRGADSGGGEALADFIVKDLFDVEEPIDLIFLCAKSRHDALPKRLSQESKIRFEEIFVYETIPSESLADELNEYLQNNGSPDVFGFFSPSGFESVVQICEKFNFDLTTNRPMLISFGKTTSSAIRKRFPNLSIDDRTCEKPTVENFVELVKKFVTND